MSTLITASALESVADRLAEALRLAMRYRLKDDTASKIAVVEKANPALDAYDTYKRIKEAEDKHDAH